MQPPGFFRHRALASIINSGPSDPQLDLDSLSARVHVPVTGPSQSISPKVRRAGFIDSTILALFGAHGPVVPRLFRLFCPKFRS